MNQKIQPINYSKADASAAFRLPKWLKEEAEKLAAKRGWPLSKYLLAATQEYVLNNRK